MTFSGVRGLFRLECLLSGRNAIEHKEVTHQGVGWVGEGRWAIVFDKEMTEPGKRIADDRNQNSETGLEKTQRNDKKLLERMP